LFLTLGRLRTTATVVKSKCIIAGRRLAYTFHTESDLWDYVTETLGAEYGCDTTDIIGTDVIGYSPYVHGGFRIATVKASR
jgi:hypothetical protein